MWKFPPPKVDPLAAVRQLLLRERNSFSPPVAPAAQQNVTESGRFSPSASAVPRPYSNSIPPPPSAVTAPAVQPTPSAASPAAVQRPNLVHNLNFPPPALLPTAATINSRRKSAPATVDATTTAEAATAIDAVTPARLPSSSSVRGSSLLPPTLEFGDFKANAEGRFKVKFRNVGGLRFRTEEDICRHFSGFGRVVEVHLEDGMPVYEEIVDEGKTTNDSSSGWDISIFDHFVPMPVPY